MRAAEQRCGFCDTGVVHQSLSATEIHRIQKCQRPVPTFYATVRAAMHT